MWQRVTGCAVPRVSPNLRRLALGYELQAKALGGLSRRSQQQLGHDRSGVTFVTLLQHRLRMREHAGEHRFSRRA